MLFAKAGEASWKAWVPGLNLVVWAKLIGRQPLWLLWLLVPIVNIFVLAYMLIELVNSFGKWGFGEQTAAVVAPFIYLPLLGKAPGSTKYNNEEWTFDKKDATRRVWPAIYNKNDKEVNYFGPTFLLPIQARPPKGMIREWADSIVFAVFAASFIRMFLIEAFTIPTSSMESTLLVGDYLFVSKVHYGSRTPSCPLALPLVHNQVPFTTMESYLTWPKFNMYRFPALEKVERYSPIVFNYPEGDSIIPGHAFGDNYYDYLRGAYRPKMTLKELQENYDVICRPVDKRDHYIKRCVGIPGDVIEVKDHVLYVNNEKSPEFTNMQYLYIVQSTQQLDLDEFLAKDIELEYINTSQDSLKRSLVNYAAHLDQTKLAHLKSIKTIVNCQIRPAEPYHPNTKFPYSDMVKWTDDNFGPLKLPTKGSTIPLNALNVALYKRAITAYEANTLEEKNGQYLLNGSPASSYTFKMDYYWMMGDNRHASADSRTFGYVPQDHIVGKPLFIWFSTVRANIANGVRFERIFTSANKK
jgi:signal peptidase I